MTACTFEGPPSTAIDASADATLEPPPLELFGVAQPINGLNTIATNDDDATFTPGMSVVFIARSDGGVTQSDIMVATSSDGGQNFEDLKVDPIRSDAVASEDAPRLSADGLTLTWSCDCNGADGVELFIASRKDLSVGFGIGRRIGELSAIGGVQKAGSLSADGRRIYFCSETGPPGPNSTEAIYVAERPSLSEPFASPTEISFGIGTRECDPWISDDELRMVFSAGEFVDRDLYEVTRPTVDSLWGPPTTSAFANINNASAESDPWLSPDLATLVFSSNRAGGQDVYMAIRL